MPKTNFVPPCAYQGGKQRLARQIVDYIQPDFNRPFYDLCCGSGAISIELINRGFPADQLVMVDLSPFAAVYARMSNGTFDLDRFRALIDALPKDPAKIQAHLTALSEQPADTDDMPYIYLLLQAGAFGSKAIWIEDGRWQNTGFRSYWQPTATSSRRSPVNPMMPMPETLFSRVAALCEAMRGATVLRSDVLALDGLDAGQATIYIDPPYEGTTAYGYRLYLPDLLANVQGGAVYISEGCPMSDDALLLTFGALKGGISGDRRRVHQEWISRVPTDAFLTKF